jgi:pyruvate dehydrogenase E2 component (dihydrolipoamide acetyltransferase)
MGARVLPITMPRWGMTMTEGKIVRWLAQEGESVSSGQDLLEVETTKITNVVEGPGPGILRRHLADDGTTAAIGALVGIIADAEVDEGEIDAFIAAHVASSLDDDSDDDRLASGGPEPRLVAAGEHRLNVLTMGSGDMEPVLFIHGFGGDLSSWMLTQPAVAAGRPTHAFDLPGHGQSSMTIGSGSVRALADAAVALIDALSIAKAHLIGHSMGGAIALLLAASKPERVTSVTAIAPGGLGPELSRGFIDAFIAADRRKPMTEALGMLFAHPETVGRSMVEEALRYKRCDGVPEALAAIAAANFTATGQKTGLRALLPSIKAPIQLIWGKADGIIPVAQADGLPANITVHRLEGVGHMPQLEMASEVSRLINAFLANHPA